MKQEKIIALAKKLNIELDSENRAVLTLKVLRDDDFLSPYCFDKPLISNDVASYLESKKNILIWKKGIVIKIISNVIDEKENKIYDEAIRNYYSELLLHKKRLQKRNYLLSLVLFMIGIVVFSFMFILDFLLPNSLGLWKEVIDVIAWVFIWEAVDIAFIEKLENSSDVSAAKNIVNSNIIFVNDLNLN